MCLLREQRQNKKKPQHLQSKMGSRGCLNKFSLMLGGSRGRVGVENRSTVQDYSKTLEIPRGGGVRREG